MFQLDVLVDRGGRTVRMGRKGIPGLIDLPKLAEQLHRTARVLRLFTFERREVDPEWLLDRLAARISTCGGLGEATLAETTLTGNPERL